MNPGILNLIALVAVGITLATIQYAVESVITRCKNSRNPNTSVK